MRIRTRNIIFVIIVGVILIALRSVASADVLVANDAALTQGQLEFHPSVVDVSKDLETVLAQDLETVLLQDLETALAQDLETVLVQDLETALVQDLHVTVTVGLDLAVKA